MKLGFVVECERDGADQQVLTHIAKRVIPDVETRFECMGNKRKLFEGAAEKVAGH